MFQSKYPTTHLVLHFRIVLKTRTKLLIRRKEETFIYFRILQYTWKLKIYPYWRLIHQSFDQKTINKKHWMRSSTYSSYLCMQIPRQLGLTKLINLTWNWSSIPLNKNNLKKKEFLQSKWRKNKPPLQSIFSISSLFFPKEKYIGCLKLESFNLHTPICILTIKWCILHTKWNSLRTNIGFSVQDCLGCISFWNKITLLRGMFTKVYHTSHIHETNKNFPVTEGTFRESCEKKDTIFRLASLNKQKR